jgi:hypothetical protein
MSKGKVFEWFLNLACLAVLAYVGGVLVKTHASQPAVRLSGAVLGKPVPLPSVDWKHTHYTLVMALSTQCHFCTASADFYRRLLSTSDHNWQAVAVFPQPVEEARGYLLDRGYSVPFVKQANFSEMGVLVTPTLFLVDDAGILRQQWIGQLDKAGEADVAHHLGIRALPTEGAVPNTANQESTAPINSRDRFSHDASSVKTTDGTPLVDTPPTSPMVATTELRELLASNQPFTIVDVRDDKRYSYGHLEKAINIPLDHLGQQAKEELGANIPVLLYCNFSPACQAQGLPSSCSIARASLKEIGIKNIRIIRDPLNLLAEAGIPVRGTAAEPAK